MPAALHSFPQHKPLPLPHPPTLRGRQTLSCVPCSQGQTTGVPASEWQNCVPVVRAQSPGSFQGGFGATGRQGSALTPTWAPGEGWQPRCQAQPLMPAHTQHHTVMPGSLPRWAQPHPPLSRASRGPGPRLRPGGEARQVPVHDASHSCAGSSSGRSSGSRPRSSGTSGKPGTEGQPQALKPGFQVHPGIRLRNGVTATRTPAGGGPALTSSSSLVKPGPSSLFTAMTTATTSLPFMTGVARRLLVS